MFTVITPFRGTLQQNYTVERLQSSSADGLKIKMGNETTIIGIRKPGLKKGELAGRTFTSPVLVKVSNSGDTR